MATPRWSTVQNMLFCPSYRQGWKEQGFCPVLQIAPSFRLPRPLGRGNLKSIHLALAIKNRIHIVNKNMDTCCSGHKEQGNPAWQNGTPDLHYAREIPANYEHLINRQISKVFSYFGSCIAQNRKMGCYLLVGDDNPKPEKNEQIAWDYQSMVYRKLKFSSVKSPGPNVEGLSLLAAAP